MGSVGPDACQDSKNSGLKLKAGPHICSAHFGACQEIVHKRDESVADKSSRNMYVDVQL